MFTALNHVGSGSRATDSGVRMESAIDLIATMSRHRSKWSFGPISALAGHHPRDADKSGAKSC